MESVIKTEPLGERTLAFDCRTKWNSLDPSASPWQNGAKRSQQTMNEQTMTHPMVGDPAPDLAYKDFEGQPRHLSMVWATGPALVVWLRHLG